MTDLSSLSNEELLRLRDEATPSTAGDVAAALGSGVIEGAVKSPFWLNDMINAAAQGVTRLGGAAYMGLGGDLSVEQARKLTDFKPLMGSEEFVDKPLAESGVGFYRPETTAGDVANILAQIGGFVGAERALTKGVGKGAQYAAEKLGRPEALAAKAETTKEKALNKVVARLKKDFPNEADFNKALNSYLSKSGESLVEKGGSLTQNLAEGATLYPSGVAKGEAFFGAKVGTAPERVKAATKVISPSTSYYDDLDTILKVGREKAAPLYNQAYKSNPSVQSKVIDRVLETPQGQSALKEAVANMQNEMAMVARPDPQLTAIAKDLERVGKVAGDTTGGVSGGLKLQTLDYIKRGFDDAWRNLSKNPERQADARRVNNLRQLFIQELDKADKTGLYAKARATAGDYITSSKAMEVGKNFFNEDPEIIARNFAKYSPSEKTAFRSGVVKAIRTNIDRKASGISDPMRGQNAADFFARKATRDKLETILPKRDFARLESEAKAVDKIYSLRNKVMGNSRTAMRQIAASEFDDASLDIMTTAARSGWKGVAIDKTINWLMKKFDGLSDNLAGEVAGILYETDPKKKYEIVRGLYAAAKKGNTGANKALEAFYGAGDMLSSVAKSEGVLSSTPTRISNELKPPKAAPASAFEGISDEELLRMRDSMSGGSGKADLSGDIGNDTLQPDYFQRLKMAESGGNPNAKARTSSASGLYQFTDSTWKAMVDKYGKQYGISRAMKNDKDAQEIMVRLLTKENSDSLSRFLKRQPSEAELRIAHFAGIHDAKRLIKAANKNVPAARLTPAAARANPTIFYADPKNMRKPYRVDVVLRNIAEGFM